MNEKSQRMRSIWYFVGLMLLVMGGLVLAAGIVQWLASRPALTAFAHLHPAVWWGGLMMAGGVAFLLADRRSAHG